MSRPFALFALLAALVPAPAFASQEAGYLRPPQEVVDLVTAPPSPSVDFSPDGRWMFLIENAALPSIADVSRRMLRLAGLRIDPAANAPFRTSWAQGLVLRGVDGGETVRIDLPAGARLGSVDWSHDSTHFTYTVVTATGTELWAGRANEPAKTKRLSERLNTVLGRTSWMPDGHSLVLREVPADRGPEPAAPTIPSGPNIQETAGDTSPLRTYQDLLSSPFEEALFRHYATSTIVVADVASGARRVVAEPAIWADVEPSPTEPLLLVTRIEAPFSYVMPFYRFPQTIAVRSLEGDEVRVVARVPAGENIPIGGVRTGPRNVQWTPHGELLWTEALDGGDPNTEADHRDRWLTAQPRTKAAPRELVRVAQRASGLQFFADGERFVTREYDRDRRWILSLLHAPGTDAPVVLEDRSIRDRYGDPGTLASTRAANGHRVVLEHDGHVFRSGSGASPEGLLPFLDRQDLATLDTVRLWRCETGTYESVALVLPSAESLTFITRFESPVLPPNYRLRRGDEIRVLTKFPDPTPQLRGIRKELVTYERPDGVALSATLVLPADYEPGTRLPLFVWAYPLEYNDPSTAGQISSSPWRFTRVAGSSHLALLTQGYAILDGATMPVIGDPETMNDTFIEQIVQAAEAAIAKAVELGVADPERVAVGGHSYGAFMTANLLAHCDLFRAGIARSGAYNRTLTPFGFQSERRTIWEAPEAYFAISPFFHADSILEPLLLIHGEVDNNSGTYPIQSERLFAAIKGNGGTARLVMLPHESHGYRAEESILHVQAETIAWFDRYVKNATPGAEATPGEAGYLEDDE